MSIATNIKRLRQLHDITQGELAKICGVSESAVSTWELGKREPRMGVIQKLADHFHLTKSELIDGEFSQKPRMTYYVDPETAEVAEQLRTNPGMRMLFSASKHATPEQLMAVANMIKQMTGQNDD